MKHASSSSCGRDLGLPDWGGAHSHLVALDFQFCDIVSQTFNACAHFVTPGELCVKFGVVKAVTPNAPQCCQRGAVTTCIPGEAEWFRDSGSWVLTPAHTTVTWERC